MPPNSYDAYSEWVKNTGHKLQSSTSIATDWHRLKFESYKSNGRVFYRGIGLKMVESREV